MKIIILSRLISRVQKLYKLTKPRFAVVGEVREYIREASKAAVTFVGVVHRLDRANQWCSVVCTYQ